MPQRKTDLTAPYQPFRGASRITGFSIGFLRDGCKSGKIPHIMVGSEYRICMPLFLQQLEAESAASVKQDTKKAALR